MRHPDLFENFKCAFALARREYLKRLDTAISSHLHDLQYAQRELRIESRALRNVAKLSQRTIAYQRTPEWRQQTEKGPEQCGLAGTIRAC